MRKKVDFAQFDEEIKITKTQIAIYSKDPENIAGAEAYSNLTEADIQNASTVMTMNMDGSEIEFDAGEDEKYELPKTINGAKLKGAITYESYKVPIHEGGEQEIGYSINIGSVGYLGDIFEETPYGIIKKNRTGVGATTLEMNSPRNSIIVVPTKSLAYKKAIKGYNTETRKYKYLYVGSSIGDSNNFPTIEEYVEDETIEYKKFIVVADSLNKVIEEIGESVFKTYFLMVDEIDIYQSDSVFRPALEKVIDYYFKFHKHRRCLVSATIRDFSNPKISCEPTINITYIEPESRRITKLIHTNNPHAIVKERIEELFANNPNEKIIIAYNKVMFIRQIIQNLNDECKAECGILCSNASEEHAGDYYRDFVGEALPAKITFMTNPFFAGIDFEERFHLISVSNVELLYTLLSPDRLQQIAGRCRHDDKLHSETIVYNTRTYEGDLQPDSYQEYLLEFANDLSEYINKSDKIVDKYGRYGIVDSVFKSVKEDICKKSERYYYKDTKMSIVRKNGVTHKYIPAYFNIDSLYDTLKLHIDLYTDSEKLYQALKIGNGDDNVPLADNQLREYTDTQKLNDEIIEREYKENEENRMNAIIERIRVAAGLTGFSFDRFLNELYRSNPRGVQKYILCVQDLYKFVPIERLLEDLRDVYNNKKAYRGYYNAVVFWALANDHIFKIDFIAKFPEGSRFSTSEIKDKINAIFTQVLHKGEIESDITAVQTVGEFIKIERATNTRLGEYTIVTHNKLEFDSAAPHRIPATDNIRTLLKYRGED